MKSDVTGADEARKTGGKRLRRKPDAETVSADQGAPEVPPHAAAEASAPIDIEYQCLEEVSDSRKEQRREEQALQVLRKNIYLAMGGSLIPIPIVDKVAVSAVEIKLLKDLSDLYKVPFSESGGIKIISALAGGLGSMQLAQIFAASGIKAVPFFGHVIAALTYPTLCGALTYALGKVFIMHYELGGNLLDFDVEGVRNYFAKQFAEGKLVVAQFQKA